jgi:3',5'-cyclic-AMP phosphodiesterase
VFTLVQLSDCHLSGDPGAVYRGQNADANLERLLPACRALKPDGIVLSGDVSEDASPDSYRRVVKLLDGLAGRIAWLPGNHDERDAMAGTFDPAGFSAGPVVDWGGWQIVLLDSAVPDRPEGHVDTERLRPLDQLDSESPALVFIHHQPIPVGARWIDKYPLVEAELFAERLDPGIIRAIGFGHVHQVFSGQLNGIACLSAPSTVANSLPGTERFTPDPTGPKARWFRLWPNGQWQTGIISAG